MLLHGIYRARYRAGHQVDADSHRHLNTNANRAAADPYAAADQSVLYGDHHPLAQPDHYLDTFTDVHAVLDLYAHTNRSTDADGNPAPDGRPDGDANHHAHPERDTSPTWTAMSEAETVQRSELPVTPSAIAADLATLGVKPGMTLLVHFVAQLDRLGTRGSASSCPRAGGCADTGRDTGDAVVLVPDLRTLLLGESARA